MSHTHKNYIIGRGSIGSLVAAVLQQAALDFCFIDTRDGATSGELQVDYQYQQTGFSLSSKVITLADADLATANIFICVKSYQLLPVLQSLCHYVGNSTRIYLLQNGMGHAELASQLCPQAQIRLLSVTSAANMLTSKTHIVSWGNWFLGSEAAQQEDDRDARLIQALSTSQITITWCNDITDKLVDKLLINASINPVTALFNVTNGALTLPNFRPLLKQLTEELAQFTRHQQKQLSAQQILQLVLDVAQKTNNNRSSMLQDVTGGRPTEIEAIVGFILQHTPVDLKLPLLEWLYTKIKAIS